MREKVTSRKSSSIAPRIDMSVSAEPWAYVPRSKVDLRWPTKHTKQLTSVSFCVQQDKRTNQPGQHRSTRYAGESGGMAPGELLRPIGGSVELTNGNSAWPERAIQPCKVSFIAK